MSKFDDIITNSLSNFRDNNASPRDYEIIFRILKQKLFSSKHIHILIDKGSDDRKLEDAQDIIQNFIVDKMMPKKELFNSRAFLINRFIKYLIDEERSRKDPRSRLFIKIRDRLKIAGYSPVGQKSPNYSPKQWPQEKKDQKPAILDELMDLDLPIVKYRAYKLDSEKADEIINDKDLDTFIQIVFSKLSKPVSIKELSYAISERIDGFFAYLTPEMVLIAEEERGEKEGEKDKKKSEDIPVKSAIFDEIRDLIKKEIIPKLEDDEKKSIYNWIIMEIPPEEEGLHEGVSHQTIRNRREKIAQKLHNLMISHDISAEEQEIFENIFMKELEKAFDPSSDLSRENS